MTHSALSIKDNTNQTTESVCSRFQCPVVDLALLEREWESETLKLPDLGKHSVIWTGLPG